MWWLWAGLVRDVASQVGGGGVENVEIAGCLVAGVAAAAWWWERFGWVGVVGQDPGESLFRC